MVVLLKDYCMYLCFAFEMLKVETPQVELITNTETRNCKAAVGASAAVKREVQPNYPAFVTSFLARRSVTKEPMDSEDEKFVESLEQDILLRNYISGKSYAQALLKAFGLGKTDCVVAVERYRPLQPELRILENAEREEIANMANVFKVEHLARFRLLRLFEAISGFHRVRLF